MINLKQSNDKVLKSLIFALIVAHMFQISEDMLNLCNIQAVLHCSLYIMIIHSQNIFVHLIIMRIFHE